MEGGGLMNRCLFGVKEDEVWRNNIKYYNIVLIRIIAVIPSGDETNSSVYQRIIIGSPDDGANKNACKRPNKCKQGQ